MRLLWLALLLLCSVAEARPARIVVLELTLQKGTPVEAGPYLTDVIRAQALTLPPDRYFVLTRENLLEALPPGVDLAACEGACEVETGRNVGADYVVSGEIIALGGSLKVALKLLRTSDGRLLGAQHTSAANVEGLEAAIKSGATMLLSHLSSAQRSSTATTPAPAAVVYEIGQWRAHITAGAEPTVYLWFIGSPATLIEIPVMGQGWWRFERAGQTRLVSAELKGRPSVLDDDPRQGLRSTVMQVKAPIKRRWIGVHGTSTLSLGPQKVEITLPGEVVLRLRAEKSVIQATLPRGKSRTF
ncbi:MAG: hypothetical protein ACE366_04650 [Bradymonadia bacterium]